MNISCSDQVVEHSGIAPVGAKQDFHAARPDLLDQAVEIPEFQRVCVGCYAEVVQGGLVLFQGGADLRRIHLRS